jgi:Tol biopolymer transport system component
MRIHGLLTCCCVLASISCGPDIPAKSALDITGAGSALERVTTEPADETHPAISPDGRVLLFNVIVSDGSVEKHTLVAVDPTTRAQRTLYTSDKSRSDDPAWIPDGSSYIYSSDSPGSLSLVRALTSAPNAAVNVVVGGDAAASPSWPSLSPDGKRIAFSTVAHDTTQIAIIGADGSRLTILGEGSQPTWSPDAKRLAFTRNVGGHSHLFLIDPDTGTNLVQLTSGDFDHEAPAWSPDGQFIIFGTNRSAAKDATTTTSALNLYLIARDGTGLTQITSGESKATQPNWGRDGWVYFASNKEGNWDIWRLRLTGKLADIKPVTLTAPAEASAPAPAPTPASTAPAATPEAASGGCLKDTDCKGDRVCEKGVCVSPTPASPSPAPAAAPATPPAPASAPPASASHGRR